MEKFAGTFYMLTHNYCYLLVTCHALSNLGVSDSNIKFT